MDIQQKNLIKLQRLLQAMDEDSLTRKEFEEQFRAILEFLKKTKEKNLTEIENLKQYIINLSEKLKQGNVFNLSGLKDQFTKSISKALKDQEDGMNFIRDTLRRIKNGKDGKDADEKKIVENVLAKIKLPEQKETILDTPETIADKLEKLKGDARLKIEAIKDLKEKLEALEQRPLGRGGSGGGGLSKIALDTHFINDETPTGTVNGVNTDFVLAHAPNPSTSLMVYKDGQRMHLVDDFSFSGRTITFNVAPLTDSIIVVDYRK